MELTPLAFLVSETGVIVHRAIPATLDDLVALAKHPVSLSLSLNLA